MSNSSVTVIIPTFNRASYLEQALQSFLQQSVVPDEIIVVDDGSTDGTRDVLDRWSSNVVALYQENAGRPRALNNALQYATGDYLWFFDDDDMPFQDALERHLGALSSDPGAGFTYSPPYISDTDEQDQIKPRHASRLPDFERDYHLLEVMFRIFCLLQGSLFRASVISDIGEFREDLIRNMDVDYAIRVARRYRGARIETPTFYLRKHEGARGTANQRFDVRDKERHWFMADQLIYPYFYEVMNLEEYVPASAKSDLRQEEVDSLARLIRANIMARRGLWQYVRSDLESLPSDIGPGVRDNPALRFCLAHPWIRPHGAAALARDRSTVRTLRRLLKEKSLENMASQWVRSMYYALRKSSITESRIAYAKLLITVLSLVSVPQGLRLGRRRAAGFFRATLGSGPLKSRQ